MQDFDFEETFSFSQGKSYVETLHHIANSNPTDLAALFDLVVFYVEAYLGSEALVAYQHLLKLSSKQDVWPKTSHDILISRLLEAFLAHRFQTSSLPQLESVQVLIQCSKEMVAQSSHVLDGNSVAFIMALIGRYLKLVKYDNQAEAILVGSLSLNPLCDVALHDYGHILLEKGQFLSAKKYFARIGDQSRYYPRAKLDIAWLQELSDMEDEAQHLKSYINAAKAGSSSTCGAAALVALGHHHHIRGNYAKAKEIYQSSLYRDPSNGVSYIFMASLPLLKASNGSGYTTGYCTKEEIDACYRRGLLSHWPVVELLYLPLLAYGQFLLLGMKDPAAAEAYLEEAAKLSLPSSVWPSIALAHYYQYSRRNFARGKQSLLQALEYRLSLLSKRSLVRETNENGNDDYSVFNTLSVASQQPEIDAETSRGYLQQIYEEVVSLQLALGYLYLDMHDDFNALKQARESFKLAVDTNLAKSFCSCANRLLGIILWKRPSQRPEAFSFFVASMSTTNSNGYTLRLGSIIYALQDRYEMAYDAMEAAVVAQDRAASNPLTWKALSLMSYLYKGSVVNAIAFMFKACDASDDGDVEALLLLGQMLLETRRFEDAVDVIRRAIIVAPTEAILWGVLAIAIRALSRFRSESSSNPAQDIANSYRAIDYETKLRTCHSLREIAITNDADEAMFVAMRLLEKQISGEPESSVSIWSSSSYHLPTIEASFLDSKDSSREERVSSHLADCIFICATYFCDQENHQSSTTNDLSSAHRQQGMRMLRQLVEDEYKVQPYPMAACLLGWMHEVDAHGQVSRSMDASRLQEDIDLLVAEKYYEYSANCCFETSAVDALTILRVKATFEDRCQYLRHQLASAEKHMSTLEQRTGALSGSRKTSSKSRLKQRMLMSSTAPISTHWTAFSDFTALDGDDLNRRKQWLIDAAQRVIVWKKRLNLNEQFVAKIGAELVSGRHGNPAALQTITAPKHFLMIRRDWLLDFMESFSGCDDWAAIRKSFDAGFVR